MIPGEDFNEGIKTELENSLVFMIVLTPSILEGENYIKIVEYPIAHSLRKSVVPVEMVPTDRTEIQTSFPNIPEVINILDVKKLKAFIVSVLKENGIVVKERDAERDFYIGYAFLKGLYVEKNISNALKMIESSANAGFLDAIAMMASVYKYGDGCEIEYRKAVAWQKKIYREFT